MKFFIFMVLLFSFGFAKSLEQLVDTALKNKPSLVSINERINANKSNIKLANEFENPELTYTQNTIDSDEAMSQKTVTLKQKLPYFGKRESLKNISVSQEAVLFKSLDIAKVELVKSIKKQAYVVWETQELLDTLQRYQELTQQNIELYESYSSTSQNKHMGIMSSELTLSELHIKKSELESKLNIAYAQLSYLCAFEVKELDIELFIKDKPNKENLKAKLQNNQNIKLSQERVKYQKAVVDSVSLEDYPDVNLIGGYSHRENFDSYWTFGVGVSLPLYSTTEHKTQKARKLTLSAQSEQEDVELLVESKFESAYEKMSSAYNIYKIINEESLAQINHMIELTNSSISTGADLFMYNDILIKKLKLEQRSISAISSFHKAMADVQALNGDLK